jgi:hypothetical protein
MKLVIAMALLLSGSIHLHAQTATLQGQITDESKAILPGATVTLNGPSGQARSATASADGRYIFAGLEQGADYSVVASAPGLVLADPVRIVLKAGFQTLDLQLKVVATRQQLTVQENAGPAVTTDPSNNASALTIKGDDLQALADDPEDLAADLAALAGPSAGPNGGSIFIDGFSGGQLPSKESIREIRINQNPFAPEYDKLGFGRIEILTKPGADKFKGTGFYNFGDSFWNTRDPYAQQKAPFLLKEYGGNVSGPIGSKASFFVDIQRHAIDNGAVINAITLDSQSLQIIDPFTQVFRVPQRRVIASPRLDYQLSANNTLSVRYQWTGADIQDSGIGSLNLVSRGVHAQSDSQTVQVTDTAVLGSHAIDETRFQFFRVTSSSIANDLSPAIQVLHAFGGGGAQVGNTSDIQNNYELQNYVSIVTGMHSWRFGLRLREATEANTSPQNFGGTFTFTGGLGPVLDANGQVVSDASGNAIVAPLTSIQEYQRTLFLRQLGFLPAEIRARGGGAAQFTLSAGSPAISGNQFDGGFFVGDDWRIRTNLTLSMGLRYELQNNIHDWRDIAPRIGLAWAPNAGRGKTAPKTVIRAGFGVFYDRFALANTLTANRFNGVVEQQYVIANPDFYPSIPAASSLSSTSTRIVQDVSSQLRAPYIMQSALGLERQLPLKTTISVTWANSHGLHQLRSADINPPLPAFRFPGAGPIFLMESSGLYNQNQVITNVNSSINQRVSLFGYYVYNRAMSNTDGVSTFPANPYNFAGEYGPAATDVRNRGSFGGTLTAPLAIRLSPLLTASSGTPFNITTGTDLYGDTLFTARPGIVTNSDKPGLIQTQYGLLDPNPVPDERIIPRNFGRGPGSVLFNLRIERVFAFGPQGEGSVTTGGGNRSAGGVFGGSSNGSASVATHHRYSLAVSLSIRNLLNHTNPGPIFGNISSPLFGRSNQSAGASSLGGTNFLESANNRRLEMQVRFSF